MICFIAIVVAIFLGSLQDWTGCVCVCVSCFCVVVPEVVLPRAQ